MLHHALTFAGLIVLLAVGCAAGASAADAPPVRCRTCPHIAICQGGTLSGRLDGTGRILPQPSVMCHDHMRFFDVVARRVQAALVA